MTHAKKIAEIRNTETGEVVCEMIVPGADQDIVSCGLRVLTHQLKLRYPENRSGGGFFGGEFGYGVEFENETFLMHPQCWCDDAVSCPWCSREFGNTDKSKYRKHYYDPPNFWHKGRDFRVKWYKYIGRDNEFNREITAGEWLSVLTEALASIGQNSLEDAANAFDKAEEESAAEMEKLFRMMQKVPLEQFMREFMPSCVEADLAAACAKNPFAGPHKP